MLATVVKITVVIKIDPKCKVLGEIIRGERNRSRCCLLNKHSVRSLYIVVARCTSSSCVLERSYINIINVVSNGTTCGVRRSAVGLCLYAQCYETKKDRE